MTLLRRAPRRALGRLAATFGLATLAATVLLVPTAGAAAPAAPAAADAGPAAAPTATWGNAADVPGPNGLFVGGPHGYVYQGNVAGDEITVVDPNSGKVIDRIGPERGVHGPDDVYVTADGTIYWTEIFAGNVGRLAPDGTWRIQHVALGTNPITMNKQGRLFTALDFLGNGLYELDPQLIAPPKLLLADIDTFNGFGFGPDGKLYGPLFFDHRVVRVDVDAKPPTVETVATGFRVPSGVDFDSKGRMIVTDFAEGQIWRIDLASGNRQQLLDIDGIIDNSAVGPDDSVYSAAFGDGQIWKIDPSGASRPLTNSGLFAAGGVAVEADGSVLVANWFTLNRYTNGKPTKTFYDRFDAPGAGMSGPNTVAVDGDNVVLSGFFSNFVQVMNAKTGAIVSDVRDVKTPTNAIPYQGTIAVAEAGNHDVVRLSDRSVLLDGLELPTGLAADGATLYAADWKTGTIWAVGGSGGTTKRAVAYGLNHPEGIALTGDGRLLVAEEGIDQVTAIDLSTGNRQAAAHVRLGDHYAPGLIDYGMLTGIALDGKGGFWVTSDADNVVYRFDLPKAPGGPRPQTGATFAAYLSGGQQNPPVDTKAWGWVQMEVSADASTLHYHGMVFDLSDVTMAHLHLGAPGVNGPVVVDLLGGKTPPTGPFTRIEGTVSASALVGPLAGKPLSALLDAIAAGQIYLNVHTTDHPAGAIRGTVVAWPVT